MPKPNFSINAADIASANLGWTVAQMLVGTLVQKKIMTASDAKAMLDFCVNQYQAGPPDRGPIRAAVQQGLAPLLKQYDVPPQGQQH